MKDKILAIGNKIEMTGLSKVESLEKKIYVSQVLEFDEEDEEIIKIAMPIYEGKLIPLQIGTRYNVCFFTQGGLYTADSVVEKRYRMGNIYMVDIRLSTELKKNQRRQYYRMFCNERIQFKLITNEEYEYCEVTGHLPEYIDERVYQEGIALDMSGGGIRFITRASVEKDAVIYLELSLPIDSQNKIINTLCQVISSIPAKNDPSVSEIRINYMDITERDRECIIKYIFQEERRKRQREG